MRLGGVKICDGYDCVTDLPKNKNAIYRWKGSGFCSPRCKAREIKNCKEPSGTSKEFSKRYSPEALAEFEASSKEEI